MNDQTTAFIEQAELETLVAQGTPVVIIDVRSAEEYASGHVAGSINIPADQLATRKDEIADGRQVVTVCNYGGARSCGAAEQLRSLGFDQVLPLKGGVKAYRQKNIE